MGDADGVIPPAGGPHQMVFAISAAADRRVAHQPFALFVDAGIVLDGLPRLAVRAGEQMQAVLAVAGEGGIDITFAGLRCLESGVLPVGGGDEACGQACGDETVDSGHG